LDVRRSQDQELSLRWRDAACTIRNSYRVRDAWHIGARCWAGGATGNVPVKRRCAATGWCAIGRARRQRSCGAVRDDGCDVRLSSITGIIESIEDAQ
jgi:hypothetical protein